MASGSRSVHISPIGRAVSRALVVAVCVASVSPAVATAAPLVSLPGTVVPSVAGAHRVAALPADRHVSIAVDLVPRGADRLAAFDAGVSTPGSPTYGHYLTPAEFTARFGPTPDEVSAVRRFLTSAGLTVTSVSANRAVVDASGTVAAVSAAFHTTLSTYSDGRRTFHANDNAVAVPASIAPIVSGVIGLDNYTVAHRASTVAGPAGGLSPTELNSAYRFDRIGATGSGQTVALWEFDGYDPSDLTAYDSRYDLSGSPVTTVSVDGAAYDSAPGEGQVEVELDSEVVRAVAPGATQLVYEAPNTTQGSLDMANKIVSDGRASVISISWGECEQDSSASYLTALDNAFSQAVAQGISIYSASGDQGSTDCTSGSAEPAVDFPGSSGHDTSVGGTTLSLTGGSYDSETAWSGSGGGVSTTFAKPSWQPGGDGRTVPDVASDAAPSSGFAVFVNGGWNRVGGTSMAAPTWSAFTLLYNEKATAAGKPNLGFANPAVYRLGAGTDYVSTLHDVTSGSNGDFEAAAGYDETTGWGSPIGDGLVTALLPPAASGPAPHRMSAGLR
jgi:subtilase family serine protease